MFNRDNGCDPRRSGIRTTTAWGLYAHLTELHGFGHYGSLTFKISMRH